MEIPVNQQIDNVNINSITLWVAKDEDEGAGDLAVNWELIGEGDIDEIVSDFYYDEMFLDELKHILVQSGFSDGAASTVTTSEQGMQDEERASYDAYDIADEVREIGNRISGVFI